MTLRKKLAIILLTFGFICLLLAAKSLIFDRQSTEAASLRVDSFPQTNIFLNDQQVAQTPHLAENLNPGEYKIKLVPTGATSGTFLPWEAKIELTGGALTYVSRILGPTSDSSGGQILTLEKLPVGGAREASIISDPDGATVTVDGQEEGRTSIILRNLSAGDHEITISLPGYSDQLAHGKIIDGYRLNIIAKLAKLVDRGEKAATTSAVSTANLLASQSGELARPYVIIKNTETGYLRVRSDPDVSATETARVKPGEKYPLLSEISGWVKIKLPSLFGWVSDAYVEKVK